MSTSMNPSINVSEILAQARAHRAEVLGGGIATVMRFLTAKLARAVTRLRTIQKQRVAVAQLLAMDERMLQDIGLNRALVPFIVAGSIKNRAADIYGDAGAVATANDNRFRDVA